MSDKLLCGPESKEQQILSGRESSQIQEEISDCLGGLWGLHHLRPSRADWAVVCRDDKHQSCLAAGKAQ